MITVAIFKPKQPPANKQRCSHQLYDSTVAVAALISNNDDVIICDYDKDYF